MPDAGECVDTLAHEASEVGSHAIGNRIRPGRPSADGSLINSEIAGEGGTPRGPVKGLAGLVEEVRCHNQHLSTRVAPGNSFSAGLHGYQNIGTAWVSATHPTIMATGQTITPATIAGIVGTTAADNAQVGSVGEYLLGGTGGNFVSSGTPANVGLLSLSPGDWDVTGVIFFQPAATTTVTGMWAGISTTSATLGGLGTYSSLQATFTTGATQFLTTPVGRINVATTTTVYIVGQASYGVSTFAYQAAIRARRVR